jgi:hypothetical protein
MKFCNAAAKGEESNRSIRNGKEDSREMFTDANFVMGRRLVPGRSRIGSVSKTKKFEKTEEESSSEGRMEQRSQEG